MQLPPVNNFDSKPLKNAVYPRFDLYCSTWHTSPRYNENRIITNLKYHFLMINKN